jgi:hypothetical protein
MDWARSHCGNAAHVELSTKAFPGPAAPRPRRAGPSFRSLVSRSHGVFRRHGNPQVAPLPMHIGSGPYCSRPVRNGGCASDCRERPGAGFTHTPVLLPGTIGPAGACLRAALGGCARPVRSVPRSSVASAAALLGAASRPGLGTMPSE